MLPIPVHLPAKQLLAALQSPPQAGWKLSCPFSATSLVKAEFRAHCRPRFSAAEDKAESEEATERLNQQCRQGAASNFGIPIGRAPELIYSRMTATTHTNNVEETY